MPRFKNPHLSYARLSRFEQCPLSFKLHYIDKACAEPGVPLRFGKAVHAVLENLVREHMEQEREGPLSEERAVALWKEAWAVGELSGLDVFQEGLDILRTFVRFSTADHAPSGAAPRRLGGRRCWSSGSTCAGRTAGSSGCRGCGGRGSSRRHGAGRGS